MFSVKLDLFSVTILSLLLISLVNVESLYTTIRPEGAVYIRDASEFIVNSTSQPSPSLYHRKFRFHYIKYMIRGFGGYDNVYLQFNLEGFVIRAKTTDSLTDIEASLYNLRVPYEQTPIYFGDGTYVNEEGDNDGGIPNDFVFVIVSSGLWEIDVFSFDTLSFDLTPHCYPDYFYLTGRNDDKHLDLPQVSSIYTMGILEGTCEERSITSIVPLVFSDCNAAADVEFILFIGKKTSVGTEYVYQQIICSSKPNDVISMYASFTLDTYTPKTSPSDVVAQNFPPFRIIPIISDTPGKTRTVFESVNDNIYVISKHMNLYVFYDSSILYEFSTSSASTMVNRLPPDYPRNAYDNEDLPTTTSTTTTTTTPATPTITTVSNAITPSTTTPNTTPITTTTTTATPQTTTSSWYALKDLSDGSLILTYSIKRTTTDNTFTFVQENAVILIDGTTVIQSENDILTLTEDGLLQIAETYATDGFLVVTLDIDIKFGTGTFKLKSGEQLFIDNNRFVVDSDGEYYRSVDSNRRIRRKRSAYFTEFDSHVLDTYITKNISFFFHDDHLTKKTHYISGKELIDISENNGISFTRVEFNEDINGYVRYNYYITIKNVVFNFHIPNYDILSSGVFEFYLIPPSGLNETGNFDDTTVHISGPCSSSSSSISRVTSTTTVNTNALFYSVNAEECALDSAVVFYVYVDHLSYDANRDYDQIFAVNIDDKTVVDMTSVMKSGGDNGDGGNDGLVGVYDSLSHHTTPFVEEILLVNADDDSVITGPVELGTKVKLIVSLPEEYRNDFDIEVTDCEYSGVKFYSNSTPTHAFFNNFTKVTSGVRLMTFNMFTTKYFLTKYNNDDDPSSKFTCHVKTCINSC